jgi:hypothetical protein
MGSEQTDKDSAPVFWLFLLFKNTKKNCMYIEKTQKPAQKNNQLSHFEYPE